MRISDWSSDVCSSDLYLVVAIPMRATLAADRHVLGMIAPRERARLVGPVADGNAVPVGAAHRIHSAIAGLPRGERRHRLCRTIIAGGVRIGALRNEDAGGRSEGRRVGQECVRTCRSGWAQEHNKK